MHACRRRSYWQQQTTQHALPFEIHTMSGFNNVLFSQTHYTPHYTTQYQIERVTIHLKDLGTTATIYPIFQINQIPNNLIKFLTQEYNDEISRGDTLPFFDQLTMEEFQNYWFNQFAAVICIGEEPNLNNDSLTISDWSKRCLGTYFIKSAYPGRCSHICTTNFLVNAGIRRHRIGFYMCECFLRWAPILGYSRCIIDLVFETNLPAKKLLERCGFNKVGKVNSCAILKSTKDLLIASLIFTKELTILEDENNGSRHSNILTYLTTGQYPESLSREDRSRLRALSYHYEVLNGKLFLKGKEVISDFDEQIRIIQEIHSVSHMGINRTTKAISNKYYWTRIKQTVKKVIEECIYCKDATLKSQMKKLTNKRKYVITEPNIQPSNIPSNLDVNWQTNTNVNTNANTNVTTNTDPSPSNSQSPGIIKRATRLETRRIDTPEELLMRQSENAMMMDLIGLNSRNHEYQQNNAKPANDNNGNVREPDFAAMINYHNGPSSQISRTISELRDTDRNSSQSFGNSSQENNFYNQNNMQYTQNNVMNNTNYHLANNRDGEEEEEDDEEDDDDYTDDQAEEVDEEEEEEEEEEEDDDANDDTEFHGYDQNRIEDVLTYASN